MPEKTRFRQAAQEVQGIYSDGKVCAKFRVRTTAGEEGDLGVVVADLNEWLDTNYYRADGKESSAGVLTQRSAPAGVSDCGTQTAGTPPALAGRRNAP